MTTEQKQPAVVGPFDGGVGPAASAPEPRAWAIFVDSGNARMWTTLQPHVQKLADAEGLQVTPLYDQAAIDAAVVAERAKWEGALELQQRSYEREMELNVSAERERIKAALMEMHADANARHNYFGHAAIKLFGA